jgi:hypothetical protein
MGNRPGTRSLVGWIDGVARTGAMCGEGGFFEVFSLIFSTVCRFFPSFALPFTGGGDGAPKRGKIRSCIRGSAVSQT